MRIGIVTHAYFPHFGGVSENVAGTSRTLRDLGHRVTVITAGAPGAAPSPDVIRVGGQRMVPWNGARVNFTFGHDLSRRLKEIYRERKFDLVHIHCPLSPMLPLAALRAANGLPVVGMFHATAESNLGYYLFREPLAREFARITVPVAVSEPARQFVAQYFPGRYRVVPNGVDIERFSPRVAVFAGRRDARRPTILVMGRLDPRKGVEHAIDALPRVVEEIGPVNLVVAGDGPRARRLQARAAKRAPGLVRFLGAIPESGVPALYAGADCVCAPAVRNESFGIVLLEAMASACPVVASDISGYRMLVVPGETGLLVPPADPDALAEALILVLADRRRALAMAEAGRMRARSYSWERVAARLMRVYREALGESPEGALDESETPGPSTHTALQETGVEAGAFRSAPAR